MRTAICSLQGKELEEASLAVFLSDKIQVDPLRVRMQKILKTAFEKELTKRQRECINLYYIEKKSVKEISCELSIRPTTVYKHLGLGVKILKKFSAYL